MNKHESKEKARLNIVIRTILKIIFISFISYEACKVIYNYDLKKGAYNLTTEEIADVFDRVESQRDKRNHTYQLLLLNHSEAFISDETVRLLYRYKPESLNCQIYYQLPLTWSNKLYKKLECN